MQEAQKVKKAEDMEAQWDKKTKDIKERWKAKQGAEDMDAQWDRRTKDIKERWKAKQGEDSEAQWDRNTKQAEDMKVQQRQHMADDKQWMPRGEEADTEFDDVYVYRHHKKKSFRLTGSMMAKIIAFFLLLASCLVGLAGVFACVVIGDAGAYTSSQQDMLIHILYNESRNIIYQVHSCLTQGDVKAAEEICQELNIDLELIWLDDSNSQKVIWSTWDGFDTALKINMFVTFNERNMEKDVTLNHHILGAGKEYLFRAYINPQFPKEDNFKRIANVATYLYEVKYSLLCVTAGTLLLCIGCFLFLMCSAGHRNGQKGIVPGVLTGIYLDVLFVLFGGGVAVFVAFIGEMVNSFRSRYILFLLLGMLTVLVAWLVIFFMDVAIRVKMGTYWRHSLIYVMLGWGKRMFCFLGRGVAVLVKGLPTVLLTMIGFFGICILELMGLAMYVRRSEVLFLWILEKAILLLIVLYVALTCKRLLKASRALAEGQEDYRVDTSKMFGDFKEHGENLNSLGRGISKAVAERMKSEHLKTELISNVSHDLKTPLTSIINYADLICEEASGTQTSLEGEGDSPGENTRIAEYAEVLLRQSGRLKKLLEDLVEASKATTGNLEVNLEPCESGVFLSQAVGEYQKRMEEKGLELITRQPEEAVKIMADGRHLWRVFDNLLNNICKYAQENSRVYLSVEAKEENVLVIFRNMSKYPLEVSSKELEERFVRGDKSRHMEGNGLGLSIAKSLIDLQGGQMEIVIDGDLFKVILIFKRI